MARGNWDDRDRDRPRRLRTRMRDAKISGMVDQGDRRVEMCAAGIGPADWDKTDPRLVVIWLVAIFLLTTWRIYIHVGSKPSSVSSGQRMNWCACWWAVAWYGAACRWLCSSRRVAFRSPRWCRWCDRRRAGLVGHLPTGFWGFSLAAILPLVVKSFGTADYMLAAALLVVFLGSGGAGARTHPGGPDPRQFRKRRPGRGVGQAHQAAQNG